MSENEIKVGDVVMLKSGGPKMTVNDIDVDGNCECLWYVLDMRNDDTLRIEVLKKIADTGQEMDQ